MLILLGPHAGTLRLQTSGLIPAGMPVRIDSGFQTQFLGGAPNIAATTSGQLSFRLTAVPEPSALALMGVACVLLIRRKRNRA